MKARISNEGGDDEAQLLEANGGTALSSCGNHTIAGDGMREPDTQPLEPMPRADVASYQIVSVDPCATDRSMTCDGNPLTGRHVPHEIYVPAHPPARPRLATVFPTWARPAYYAPVAEALAHAGWHDVLLGYVATTVGAPTLAVQSPSAA